MSARKKYTGTKKAWNEQKRETFSKLYDRTCEKIYFYSFECCLNDHDAELIFRDAFVYMYQHIGELRKSQSVDIWQKQCVEKAFRSLLRTQLLDLLHDQDSDESRVSLSEIKKEELWFKINKMAEIDPWRLVPVPGKSTIFSVFADQTMSDLRYMTVTDYVKSAALIIGAIAIVFIGIKSLVTYIQHREEMAVEKMQEIFLDERNYDGYDTSGGKLVDDNDVDHVTDEAEKKVVVSSGDTSGKYVFAGTIGRTAGQPVSTGDADIDNALSAIVNEQITDDMTDYEALEALYDYVGHSMVYSSYIPSGEDELSLVRDYFNFHAGDSRHYSALYAALCKTAGYSSCKTVHGSFILNRDTEFERAVEHYWNQLSINGIIYYLDVEADCDADGVTVRRNYFMATNGNNRWKIFQRDHEF